MGRRESGNGYLAWNLTGQITDHIDEARGQLVDETDADLLSIIDRLGVNGSNAAPFLICAKPS
jgi:hypothetical protein